MSDNFGTIGAIHGNDEITDGVHCIVSPPCCELDINLNGVDVEVGDAILFANYFLWGPSVWHPWHSDIQIYYSDVNKDNTPLTVADLVALIRIISGEKTRWEVE